MGNRTSNLNISPSLKTTKIAFTKPIIRVLPIDRLNRPNRSFQPCRVIQVDKIICINTLVYLVALSHKNINIKHHESV